MLVIDIYRWEMIHAILRTAIRQNWLWETGGCVWEKKLNYNVITDWKRGRSIPQDYLLMREIAEDHDWDDSNDAGDSDDSRPAEARVSAAGELPVVIWASPLHSCEFLSPCLSFSLPVTIILGSRVAAGENWRQEKCFSCSNDNSKNCLRGYFGLSPGGRGERSDCDWIWIFDLSPVLGVLPVNFNAPVIQFLSLPTSLEGSWDWGRRGRGRTLSVVSILAWSRYSQLRTDRTESNCLNQFRLTLGFHDDWEVNIDFRWVRESHQQNYLQKLTSQPGPLHTPLKYFRIESIWKWKIGFYYFSFPKCSVQFKSPPTYLGSDHSCFPVICLLQNEIRAENLILIDFKKLKDSWTKTMHSFDLFPITNQGVGWDRQ